jgi:hypothetical protein
MKPLKLILGASLVAVILTASAAEWTAPQPFKIEVDLAGSEMKMRCVAGCTWVTTSYACGSKEKGCSFLLDENGVQGMAPAGR